MCQFCDNKNKKPLYYKENSPKSIEEHIFKVYIAKKTLNIKIKDNIFHPEQLDYEGELGNFEIKNNINQKININFCPMCGRKLKENENN